MPLLSPQIKADRFLQLIKKECWEGVMSPACFPQRSDSMACASLGEVVLLMNLPADSPAGPAEEGHHLPDGRMTTPVSTFSQQDIDDGIVWYRHSGAPAQSDSFHFQVPSASSPSPFAGCMGHSLSLSV